MKFFRLILPQYLDVKDEYGQHKTLMCEGILNSQDERIQGQCERGLERTREGGVGY